MTRSISALPSPASSAPATLESIPDDVGSLHRAVSEDRGREEARGAHGDLFRSLFQWSGICIASLDPQLRLVEANSEFSRQFDQPFGEAYGRRFEEFLHPATQAQVRRQFTRLTNGQRTRFAQQVVAVGMGGSVFSGELTGVPVHDDAGRLTGYMVLVRPEKPDEAGNGVMVHPSKVLTDLDARILEGVAAGASTVQLAAKLYMSRQGVEYHVSGMLRRLKAPNRAALVSRAYSMGVLRAGSWPPQVVADFVK